ncbi:MULTISPECIES: IGHMBP2 family helicase [Halanaerobium]|jgi:predicted DNA helicase|uniref:DNA helicase n=1 Tax=Halanaerobium kushneri TaxID=56779 RepID=A0A1N6W4L4_9FIRM|nr:MULTISPECIES: IGHMBP2 family helicase [Halanaerobium]RCW53985.1 putative DNA helicase [Halanaerobium sp. ST460_2HS_T2]SIQ84876.1 DNA helicase, putative [Halanaerobium kushneri]
MVTLVISEIDKRIGPGDIVGAFINEAGTASDDIGKINIDKNKKQAEVEVNWESAPQIIRAMDNNQIGGVKVQVSAKNPDDLIDKEIINYYNRFHELVDLERQEEIDRHKLEIKYLSARERQAKGRALLELHGKDNGTTFGHRPLVKFTSKYKGEKLAETQITPGDLVMISLDKPLHPDNPTGTVVEKTSYSITVAFESHPPEFIYNKGVRLDLFVNDTTFQRMFTALDKIKNPENQLQEKKRDILLERKKAESAAKVELELEHLNQSQKAAVENALAAEDIYLIQGPPGTGKTVTAVELIARAVDYGNKVLAAAESNTAVDNLLELLAEKELNVIRIGHPIRVNKKLREHTLDEVVMEHPDYLEAEKLRDEVSDLINRQESYIYPGGKYRRGLSDQEIKNYAEKDLEHHVRGISPEVIGEMANWLELQEKIDSYFRQIEQLENKAVEELLDQADVICTTNITAGSELLENRDFDLSVIDEATQATQPAALIPYLKAEKTILIGDHKQLPPTVVNQEAVRKGLSVSLFEKLIEIYPDQLSSMLETQYRMNREIMGFSSIYFYNNSLKAADSVAGRKLSDLGVKIDEDQCFTEKSLKTEYPMVFLDTKEMKANERSFEGSNSYDNPVESEIVLDILDRALKSSLSETDIAVIAAYKDQVDLINQHNSFKNVEIDTVDAFQGREKEMIVFSAVRSNQENNIGFLRDLRRLNVALTRAKRKMIFIGDSSTICEYDAYAKLLKYIKKSGLYYKL